MNARKHVICLAAYAAVFAFDGGANANRDSQPAANVLAQERVAEPLTCVQATQHACVRQARQATPTQ